MVHTAGIEDSKWVVAIGGFRCGRIDDVDDLLHRVEEVVSPCVFQLFDADKVAGWEHLYFAAVNAARAFDTGSPFSKNLAIEILLYASCRDQITRALDLLGLSTSTKRAALLVMADSFDEAAGAFEWASKLLGVDDDSVLDISGEKVEVLRRVYSITDQELDAVGGSIAEALTSLVIERCALLAGRR